MTRTKAPKEGEGERSTCPYYERGFCSSPEAERVAKNYRGEYGRGGCAGEDKCEFSQEQKLQGVRL